MRKSAWFFVFALVSYPKALSAQTTGATKPVAPAAQTAPVPKPAEPATAGKISGYVFGDYYYFGSSHDTKFESQNGFWLRRAYFTYDQTLGDGFSSRLRLEMNSTGDLTNAKLTPFVKDAYLKWTRGAHALVVGISGTPTFEYIESFWGYRFIEKTPLDLQRWDGSRDLGVAAQGTLDAAKTVNYHVMFGNGSDTGSEVNKNKTVRVAFSVRGKSGFAVEGYADWQDQPADADRNTAQIFVGYRKASGRVGVQYSQQTRRSAAAASATVQLASAFAVGKVNEKNFVVARFDRMFDPNSDGAKVPYLPFNTEAKSSLGIIGWDFVPNANVHISPNVEFVKYGNVRGAKVGSDVVPRLTLYYMWQ